MALKTKAIVKTIGVALIAFGIYSIISGAGDIYSSIIVFFTFGSSDLLLADIIYINGSIIFFSMILPIVAIVTGWGFARNKKWGWRWAIIFSLTMLAANVIKAISLVFIELMTKNLPMQELPSNMPAADVNVWPLYICAALSLLLAMALTLPAIKKEFS